MRCDPGGKVAVEILLTVGPITTRSDGLSPSTCTFHIGPAVAGWVGTYTRGSKLSVTEPAWLIKTVRSTSESDIIQSM